MKITITPTGELTEVNGAKVRRWEGQTEGGQPLDVFVALIGARSAAAEAELDASLRPVLVSSAAAPGPARRPRPRKKPAAGQDPDFNDLAEGIAQCRGISLELEASDAVYLISVIQLASRHPTGRLSPTVQRVLTLARGLQDALAEQSPDVGRILEQGWHEVFDVPREDLHGE